MTELVIRNRQRVRALHISVLRHIARHLMEREFELGEYEIGFHFVDAPEMARVNQKFLRHAGSTDVITFDHGSSAQRLHGEIFICIPDAVAQAREFNTTWQAEVVRYVIHGLLHLRGFDDLQPAKRREMKREEERLLGVMQAKFHVHRLARTRSRKLKPRNSS